MKAETSYRIRLLDGLAQALEKKRYREITLADIAAAARVSRRTFYEHFQNKDDCLLALADHTSKGMMVAVLEASSTTKVWSVLVRDITQAYLFFIESKPHLMRALYIDLAALGESGVQMRRKVAEQFAVFLQKQVEQQRAHDSTLQSLSLLMSMALVAGINELILYELTEKDNGSLMALAPTAEELIHRVATGQQ
ncbi:TetR/AcrR family transcriptional regulator [Marinobacter sp. 1-3A]|uniref:TetR/AcrR family transcriptional regulator n=1 Tax=unclassified Marinobacter TaxID=83889 RepID=UPI0019040A7C|nr:MULTISPECIES: TetR/AcrR family transcriptional regulator [unclassified Marinobacter]MBK1874076.1 TetR/AcrR family transcriptional regulator [Marinobacter sp. 1-3A]MBK1888036.1 TetR/AcrR family transcriptional regulator [Marinobacter sp. DY40_1A1]